MTVREYLFRKKMKHVELCQRAQIPMTTFSLYLNGWRRLPPKYVQRLADFLEITEAEVQENRVRAEGVDNG